MQFDASVVDLILKDIAHLDHGIDHGVDDGDALLSGDIGGGHDQ